MVIIQPKIWAHQYIFHNFIYKKQKNIHISSSKKIFFFLAEEEHRICVKSSSTVAHVAGELSDEAEEGADGAEGSLEAATFSTNQETGERYVHCTSHTHHCYALWQEDGNGSYVIMKQGL